MEVGATELGAVLVLRERLRWERWVAALVGFAGVLCSLPLGLMQWQTPSTQQWGSFLLCGVLGSAGHDCLTRSFTIADISATRSVKFLELVWAAALGWLMFSDTPSRSTLIGGVVIAGSTLRIARRENRRPP